MRRSVVHVPMDGMRPMYVSQLMVVPLGTYSMGMTHMIFIMDMVGYIMMRNMTVVDYWSKWLQAGEARLVGMRLTLTLVHMREKMS